VAPKVILLQSPARQLPIVGIFVGKKNDDSLDIVTHACVLASPSGESNPSSGEPTSLSVEVAA
jgi:hypothetical protein